MLRFAAAKNPYILSLGSAASRREEIRGGLNGFGLRITSLLNDRGEGISLDLRSPNLVNMPPRDGIDDDQILP